MTSRTTTRVHLLFIVAILLTAGACAGNLHTNFGSSNAPGTDSPSDGNTAIVGDGNVIVPAPATRGATLPYFEYEAESATTNGTVLSPNRTFGSIESESSGRSAVLLDATGQSVTFKLEHPANSVVVRYVVPDALAGGGASTTLGLYINGKRTDLDLTSRYAWTYGDADAQGIASESPTAGTPHHFYDEVHALFDSLPADATIVLQRDAQDTAAYYVIDLVDFEDVAAPLTQPAGSISITDFGATPNDGTDDSAAITKAIAAAQVQNVVLWIPPGTFDQPDYDAQSSTTPKLIVSGIKLQGAGMWHSVLQGFGAQFSVSGTNNTFSDFAVFGDVTFRDDTKGWQAFDGPAGTASTMTRVWIEHANVGWWVGKGDLQGQVTQPLTDGLIVHGIRVRNTYADGINFADATKNSIIEQSSFRNTGDDGIATWSNQVDGAVPCTGNTFRFNTVQAVWRANCLAIYGGMSNSVTDNVCADTSNDTGLLVSTTFNAIAFSGTTTLQRNTLIRAGGPHYGQQFGALRFFADTASVTNVQASDIVIESPTYSGIQFGGAQQISNVTLDNMTVTDYGTVGIWISSESTGSAHANSVNVSGGAGPGLQNDANSHFVLNRGTGNSGW